MSKTQTPSVFRQTIDILNSIFNWAVISIVALISSICTLTMSKLFKIKLHRSPYIWAKIAAIASRNRYNVKGMEHMAPDQDYVIVANHRSYADIHSLYYILKRNIIFVEKEELRKIPLVGAGMAELDFIFVNRENSLDGMKALMESLNLLKDGTSIAIFPEGSRTKDLKLGEFKKGAFFIAKKANKPILPVIMQGTENIMPRNNFLFRSGQNVEVEILEPIDSTGLSTDALMKETRARFDAALANSQ